MELRTLHFVGKILSSSSSNSMVKYDVLENDVLCATLVFPTSMYAEISLNGTKYLVRAVIAGVTIKSFGIFSVAGLQIGEIQKCVGWNSNNPQIVLYKENGVELWIYDRNQPGFFGRRRNPYTAKLESWGREIVYNVTPGRTRIFKENIDSIGQISFGQADILIPVLGIYVYQQLLFHTYGD